MKAKIILCILLVACNNIIEVIAQNKVDYVESTAIISNPARGLQKYSITNNTYNTQANYSNLSQTTLTNWRTGADKVTVIFRYFLLDAYLNSNISQTYLNNMQKDFDIIRNAGLKCIVRFSYSDAQGTTPQQPTKAQILTHINQVSSVLTANKDIIFSYQAGYIGTWGEWYYTNSTEFGTDGTISAAQWSNRKEIIDAMLASVPQDIFVQVRYPLIKQKMYGTQKLTSGTAYQNTAAARIGFFNDAFLNNWGDMGTYSVNSGSQTPVGTSDYTYLANDTYYTPMSGETNGLNAPRTDGSNAVYEMDSTNWTCLNRDYDTDVWNVWISAGKYDEILKRLGYRFVLKSSTFNLVGNNLSVNLSLDNKGFARVFNNRKAILVLQNITTNAVYKFDFASDPRTWDKSVSILETFNIGTLPDGDYESYVYLPDNNSSISSRQEYAIQFANDNVWQASTGYNKLSQQVKKTTTVTNQLPTVSITSPTNGANFTAPASVTINATANDADGTISKVEFYNGTTILNSDNTLPYSYIWTSVAAGTYSITAKAYDNVGAVTTSSAVSITVNQTNQLPTVSITSPTNGANYTAPASVTINATANDADGTISKVEFYNGSTLLNSDNASPFSYVWSGIAAGTYSITAKAYDNVGAITTSTAVSITVNPANQLPTVSITSPTNAATFIAPASVTINAAANDADGSISKVEFYNGTTLLNSDNSSPYSYVWTSVAAGTYSITAKAYDNVGAVTTSSAVSITVNPANQLPTVSITSPSNGANFTAPASVTINATANDADGSITKIEFYNGATLLNSDNASPFSYVWSGVAAGTYSITAKAFDNVGAVTTSAAVSITVNPGQTGTEDCSNIALWNSASIYVKDNLVVFNGYKYKAKWWTQNNSPATNSGQWDVWINLGQCISNTMASSVPSTTVVPLNNTSLRDSESLIMNVTGISSGNITQVIYILYKDQVVSSTLIENGPNFSGTLNGLAVGDYLLQVITKDQNGMLIYSDAKTVSVTQATGITSEINKGIINVIPNPNDSRFHISFPLNLNINGAKMELSDMTGQKVYESVISSKDEEFWTGELKAGIYILKLITSEEIYTSKIYIR